KTAPSWEIKPNGAKKVRMDDTGLSLQRRLTRKGVSPLDRVTWVKGDSMISSTEGSVVFEMKGVEVPEGWSQLATDIVVSKYFRKAGVPGVRHETSARQVVGRVARTLREAGEMLGGSFRSQDEADVFEAELSHLLIHQHGA